MKTYTSAELTSWLRDVYQTHALTVHQRLPYSSFHHHVECLGITSPDASIPRQVILRMYRGTLSWWCQETADLAAREWLGLRHAASAGVVVPKLLSARETPLGKASLLQYIAGNSLRRQRHVPNALQTTARALASLHQSATPPPTHTAGNANLEWLLERLRQWSHELQNPLIKIALQVAAETSEKIEYTSQVLHGDFHAGNVIVDDCGNPTLMDWEELAVGDPRWDIATMLDSLGWDSPAAKRFLEAYQTAIGNRVGHLPTFRGLKLLRNGCNSNLLADTH